MSRGRHSVAYIAAQQGPSPGPGAYVGRVGALALALGIGAAIFSNAGVALAEGSEGADTGDSAAPSPGPAASEAVAATPADGEAPEASQGPDSTETKPHSPVVPKMRLGNGRDGLPELLARIPEQHTSALAQHRASGSAPSRPRLTDKTPPAEAAPVTARKKTTEAAPADAVPEAPSDIQPVASEPTPATRVIQPVTQQLSAPPALLTSTPAPPAVYHPIRTVISNVLTALGISPTAGSTRGTPTAPMPILQAALQLVRRELELFTAQLGQGWPTAHSIPTNPVPSETTGVPTPADEVATEYGDIGKWMLQSNGEIANYGGLPYDGRTVLEPVNVIIVDPTSSSAEESARKLNWAMFWSGFPAQPIHSTGFGGTIDDVTYGQQPVGLFLGYSDNFFLLPNNHGRIFGPDPIQTDEGYVWTGAFSTEQLVFDGLIPKHGYVSSNMARNALALRLICSGQATYGGMVPLHNAYNTETTTTGDHDGYAVVIILK